MLKIIHISDFHLENEDISLNKEQLISALAKDLQSKVNDDTVVCITGDLINKGASSFKNEEEAYIILETVFFDKLIELNPILKGRIFVVPGNHDINRKEIDAVTEAGLNANLKDENSLDEFIKNNHQKSLHLSRIENYLNWQKDFYKNENYSGEISNFENSFTLKTKSYNIGVTCLNSSWLSKDDNDKGKLLIGRRQIDNSLRSIENCDIKIALSHHPIEFLQDFDREAIKPLLSRNYDILLNGHVHELDANYIKDLFGSLFVSIATSTIADNPTDIKHQNGYSIVEFEPKEYFKVVSRKYLDKHKKFVPNTEVGTEDGIRKFIIPRDESLTKFNFNQELIINIGNRYSDRLNDHILMSDANTSIECTIENLFVHPIILNTPQGSLKEESTVKYSITDIIIDNSNFLIYGMKESGKTILLDKMFLELTKNYNKYNKIPILIKFGELKKSDPKKLVKEFLGIPSSEIDSFISSNELLLLVDDLYYNGTISNEINKLNNFLKQNQTIQLITTSTQTLEDVIPIKHLDYNPIFDFKLAFIQSFGSNEIKQLIKKWFVGSEVDLQDNMQKLIKSFGDFGLPKTPLSITLFLWIFEKQEKKPINNSILVELFIENLLEKTKIENIYSETFGFKNKKRLLSYISKFMHDNGNPDMSYSVEYSKLLEYVTQYLKTRFTGKPHMILEDFIKRGILFHHDDNTIKFKSAFYFHFFLALLFDYDKDFKSNVFKDDNYLNYLEEINYYTGLKGDDADILKFTQKKLNIAFERFNSDIINNWSKIDTVLESKNNKDTISFNIDVKRASTKLTSEQENDIYDEALTNTQVKQTIQNKDISDLKTQSHIDKVLKLSANVLKNSEDVDSFELKNSSYSNVITSSISFLMLYRDSLLKYYQNYKKEPDHFPKNIDFPLFIKILPLIHQVVVYNWLGSKKIRTILLDKMERDIDSVNISEFEKFMTIFIYSDIKGSEYPEKIKSFVKTAKSRYIKDLSYLKIMSYYHLRNNDPSLDKFYLTLMSEIKHDIGQIKKQDKGRFIESIKSNKSKE